MNTYHFIGLGGIGMSALARVLLQRGERVQGSDIRSSPLLDELKKEGATVQVGHNPEWVSDQATVIYSTDVKGENVEILRAKELKLPMLHRSDLLDLLMKGKKPLLVTGTHGKTTTSGLLAKVLIEGGLDPSFVVGGILHGLKTNGKAGLGEFFVAEADESDGSFLKTSAFGAIVTNLENEHLEYWKEPKELDKGFSRFFSQIEKPDHLFWCADDPRLSSLKPPGYSYGFSDGAIWKIDRFRQVDKGIVFDLKNGSKIFSDIEVSLYGRHNALNAAAVFALALSFDVNETLIRKGLNSFSGVSRRLEFKGSSHEVEVFDDYGHHPTEIAATLSALRGRIGEKRLIAVFQPHRYTRVRDLFEEFFNCFEDADIVVMTDIYAAGEPPIEGITSASFYMRMREKLGAKLHFISRLHLESGVANMLMPHDVVLTIGAGDVTRTGEPILRHLADLKPKWKVGIIFNGATGISAKQFYNSLDPSIYEIKLFGVTEDGNWMEGESTFEKIEHHTRLSSDAPKISSQILEKIIKCQIVFPLFQGVQGLFEVLGIAYSGCSSSVSEFCKNPSWVRAASHATGLAENSDGRPVKFIVRGNRKIEVESLEALPPAVEELGLDLAQSIYLSAGCEGIAEVNLALDEKDHYSFHSIDPFPPGPWNRQVCNGLAISALHRRRG